MEVQSGIMRHWQAVGLTHLVRAVSHYTSPMDHFALLQCLLINLGLGCVGWGGSNDALDPPRGWDIIKTLHYLSAGSWDGASISPHSMESLAINRGVQEERVIDKEEAGGREGMMQREKGRREVRVTAMPEIWDGGSVFERKNSQISGLLTEHFTINCLQRSLLSK